MWTFALEPARRLGRVLAWGVVLAAAVASPAVADPAEFPVSSLGDIWFQADHAGFLDGSGRIFEEYYLRIVNSQIHFRPEGEGFAGRVFVQLRFRDEEGRELGVASRRFLVKVSNETIALSGDDAELLLIAESFDPRTRSVEIEVEDLGARKRGLLYLITGKRRGSRVEACLIPPAIADRSLALSDLQLAWDVQVGGADTLFRKGDFQVTPNPGRIYGLLNPELAFYYQVYDQREGESEGTYAVRHEVLSPEGDVVRSDVDTLGARGRRWEHLARFDLTGLEPGAYTARAVVTDLGDQIPVQAERRFSLIWENASWARSEQDILDEVRVLFTEADYDRFREMSAGDRELTLQQFWTEADPTPQAPGNAVREEFRRRVAHANREFKEQLRKGMLSDRGRLYIRFGPPDEVERELLPTQGHQLDQQVEELARENAQGRTLRSGDQFDVRPFEIWTYTRQGEPLFPERERTTTVTGLRFVFVDDTGTGHYVLRYSSDFIGY